MRQDGQEELLRYYWRELTYLRKAGAAFAQAYPKVAGRLELSAGESADPHVERLIESFAFLAGRVQHNIDRQFPEIASELLELLYPHYLRPIPSLAIARFEVDPARGKLTTGHLLPKDTPLFAQGSDGSVCRFRTSYPVTLWPLEVARAGFEPVARYDFLDRRPEVAAVLRLRIAAAGTPLAELQLDRLRFHLAGDRMLVGALYELLFAHTVGLALLPEPRAGDRAEGVSPAAAAEVVELPAEALSPVGFGADEEALPYPRVSHPAYRLVQEYFVFPEKFHFFDVSGLARHGSETSFDLLVLLDRAPQERLPVGSENFLLGCAPVVNLFSRTTEPIRLDHRKTEYQLVADARRERTTEIHSVLAVSASADPRDRTRALAPFYSFDHRQEEARQRAFWHARRVPSTRPDLPGTETLLTVLDLDFHPRLPAADTLYAHVLCTNRDLAEKLPAGALLQTDVAAPLSRIVCLDKPTQEIQPPLGGGTLWRLVSHLSLNHLSLEGEAALPALREILRLYCFADSAVTQQQVAGIVGLEHRRVVRRTGEEAWRGFCRGSEVTITFDEEAYVGSSAFLLAAVLNHFFGLYTAVNSFTQTVAKSRQRDGVWKRWPPLAGEQTVL